MSASDLTRMRRAIALAQGVKPILPGSQTGDVLMEKDALGFPPVVFDTEEIKPCCPPPASE
jgi:hypothetical protein